MNALLGHIVNVEWTHSECEFSACLTVHCWLSCQFTEFPLWIAYAAELSFSYMCAFLNGPVSDWVTTFIWLPQQQSLGLSHESHTLLPYPHIQQTVCSRSVQLCREIEGRGVGDDWEDDRQEERKSVRWITSGHTENCVCVSVIHFVPCKYLSVLYVYMWPTVKSNLVQSVSSPSDSMDRMQFDWWYWSASTTMYEWWSWRRTMNFFVDVK